MKARCDSTASVLLRLAGRIMVVFGALGLALNLLGLAGLLLLGRVTNGIFSAGRDMVGMGIFLLASAAELTAGLLSLRAAKRPERAGSALLIWDVLTQTLGFAGIICLALRAAAPSVWKLALCAVLSAVLPAVDLFAAVRLRRGAAGDMSREAVAQASGGASVQVPAQTSAGTSREASGGAFVQVPAQAPAGTSREASGGASAEAPVEASIQAPAGASAETAAGAAAKALAEALAQAAEASREAAAGQAKENAEFADGAKGADF